MDDFDERLRGIHEKDRIYRVGDWQDDYLLDPDEAIGRLREALVEELRRLGAHSGRHGDPEDLVHDKLAEWFAADPAPKFLGWPPSAPFAPYVRRIARNLRIDESLRRGRLREAGATPHSAAEDPAARGRRRMASLRMDLDTLQDQLPRPWAQILAWLRAGETTRQIAGRLREWAGTRSDESRRLVRETRGIVKDTLRGDRGLIARLRGRGKNFSEKFPHPPPHRNRLYPMKALHAGRTPRPGGGGPEGRKKGSSMFEAQYLHVEPEGAQSVYSPWFPRGGDHGRFTADLIQAKDAALEVEVLTKNTETAGDGGSTLVTASGLTAIQQHPVNPALGNATLELVRYKFTITSTDDAAAGFILFRMLAPVWFDAVTV